MKLKKLTELSLLLALSLIIFIVEAQLPPPVPIPGIKLGLANIITLVTLVWYGRPQAFTVLILRIMLSAVFVGHPMSFLYSMSGGILCFITMSLIKTDKLWVVSIFGAIAHNTGQLITAALVTSASSVLGYLPVLIISAVISGAFTGIAAQLIIKNKLLDSWRKRK